jgi:hypothetical protein
VARITAVHHTQTGQPVVAGNYFAVTRKVDITVTGHGRIQTDELMVYQVTNGKIVSAQILY